MCLKFKVFAIFVLCSFNLMSGINADTFEECKDVDPETYVASSESCSAYILCDGDDSELYECDEGEYFDIESESCDAKENVFCPLENNEEGGEDGDGEDETEEPEEETTIASFTTTFTTVTPITSSTTTVEILDIPPIVKDTCPATDDPNQIVYTSSNNSCSDFYVCYHGHPVEMHCTDHLHFNTLTGKCDFPENSNCKVTIFYFFLTQLLLHFTNIHIFHFILDYKSTAFPNK